MQACSPLIWPHLGFLFLFFGFDLVRSNRGKSLSDHFCNIPALKKKNCMVRFLRPHMTHATHMLPHHTNIISHSHSLGWSTRVLSTCFLFHFLTNENTPLSVSHPLPLVYLSHHHLHHHFFGKITRKSLKTSKLLHIFYLR